MTEPIIIDDCNVAECEHHYTNLVDGITYHGCSIYEQTNELGYQQDTICEQNPNCYFKQLIRTRQINSELISKANAYDKLVILANDRLDIIDRLKQENKKIKKQYNCYACGNCNGKEDYINLEKHHKGLRKQFDELVKRNNTLSLRIEEIENENEELKYEIDRQKDTILYLQNYDICHKTLIEYKQALEEIKKETHRLFYELNPIYGYNNSNHFEFLAKFVMKKTDEVLNDRD